MVGSSEARYASFLERFIERLAVYACTLDIWPSLRETHSRRMLPDSVWLVNVWRALWLNTIEESQASRSIKSRYTKHEWLF